MNLVILLIIKSNWTIYKWASVTIKITEIFYFIFFNFWARPHHAGSYYNESPLNHREAYLASLVMVFIFHKDLIFA